MSEQNFSFENRPERGYLYALLAKLNQMGRDNLLVKNIETMVRIVRRIRIKRPLLLMKLWIIF